MEPGPDADKAWDYYESVRPVRITKSDVLRLGKDPRTAARYEDSVFELGSDAYIAPLDVFHQIHCLNELRKNAFADYGEERPTKKKHGRLWWIHLRHCTDMLLQNIKCHADADIVTYNWLETQQNPFPDFNINRKCRNFHALDD